MAKEGILLEAGTNEMELLVFRLDQWLFGVNVAKVREIVQRQETIALPYASPIVEGTFRLRDEVLTLVNVGRHFSMEGEETQKGEGLIIIMEFNKTRCGVLVDGVEMIHRLSWDDIEPPSAYLQSLEAPVTGIARLDGKLVLIADFESVIGTALGGVNEVGIDESGLSSMDIGEVRVLMADDSPTIRGAIQNLLKEAGLTRLTVCKDGLEAWETLERVKGEDEIPFDLIITDIEMPRMDGLHLTSRIKKEPELRDLPVILFSSLISSDNAKKGEQVGADAQVTKLEGDALFRAIAECLKKSGKLVDFWAEAPAE